MDRRGWLILGGVGACGLLVVAVAVAAISSRAARPAPRPPELGGQPVPAAVLEIRFDRKYDLYCSFFGPEPTVYRNCKVLGYTGRAGESSGSGGFSSSGSGSYYSTYFDHWLVLELADGRLAYIPPAAVKYLEQAAPAAR